MSLILDALSRAEQERRSGDAEVPDLLTQTPVEPESKARWLPVVLAAIALLAVAVAILLWRPWEDPDMSESASVKPPVSTSPQVVPASSFDRSSSSVATSVASGSNDLIEGRSSPAAASSSMPSVSSGGNGSGAPATDLASTTGSLGSMANTSSGKQQDSSDSASIAALYASAQSSADAEAQPSETGVSSISGGGGQSGTGGQAGAGNQSEAARQSNDSVATRQEADSREAPTPQDSGSAQQSVAQSESPRASSDAAPNAEEELDVEAILRQVQREAAAVEVVDDHPVPLLADQSKQFRDSVPTLMYLRHDYQGSRNSTVYINGESLRVGQRTRNVEVREILPDFVVLRFQGTEFRLRALNSWVNL